MTAHHHLDDELLSADVDGEADPGEAAVVAAALASCAECAARHGELAEMAALVRSLPSEAPPSRPLELPDQDAGSEPSALRRALGSPRLVGGLTLAAAVILGFLVGPRLIPDGALGRPAQSLTQLGAGVASTDLPVRASTSIPGGGTLTLSTAAGSYAPGQPVPIRLLVRGTHYDAVSVTVRAVRSDFAAVISSSGSLKAAGQAAAGDAGVPYAPQPESAGGGGSGTTSGSGSAPAAAERSAVIQPAAPHDADLLDSQWAARTTDGRPLSAGTYQLTAEVTLADGSQLTLQLPIQVTP